MKRSAVMYLKYLGIAVAFALFIPGQVSAQICTADLSGPDLTGQLFFVGDPITIDLEIGAGEVTPELDDFLNPVPDTDYLDISQFHYALDCEGSGSLDCVWAGNDVSLVPNSVTTNCTIDGSTDINGNPNGVPVNLDAILQNVPPGTAGTDPSPSILFKPSNGPIRNFSNNTCDVSFQIVVNGVTGDNPQKVIYEFTGWSAIGVPGDPPTPPEGQCGNGLSAAESVAITFDLSTEVTRFRVTKDFWNDSSTPVDVYLRCNGGLPLEQNFTIIDPASGGSGFEFVEFVVRYIDSGEVDCEIWEEPVPTGYDPVYTAAAAADGVAAAISPPNGTACSYTDIQTGSFTCEISNQAEPVEITVYKEWIGDFDKVGLERVASANYTCYDVLDDPEAPKGKKVFGTLDFTPTQLSDTIGGIYNNPNGESYCEVEEVAVNSAVEADDSDCSYIPVAPGEECTIYNTLFFEGIPTLDRYGLAVLVLLMLGVGLVGMRRLA